MRPLLLIDVDGPLSPFDADWFPDEAGDHGYQVHELTVRGGETYQVALNPEHGAALRDLAEDYELAWATTWGEEANRLLAPILGLPPSLRVLPLPPHAPPRVHRRHWKAEHVAEWCAGREFAWIDDEINRATRDWLAHRPGVGRHLALRVPADRGLAVEDVEALRAFVAELQPRS